MASSKSMTKKEASHQCCVPYCPNNWGQDRKTNTKRSYHSFPSVPSKRELWLKAIDRGEDWQPNKYSCVCGDHFIGGRATIEEGSASYVPTIFPPKPPPTKPLPPKKPPSKKSKSTPRRASAVGRPASNVTRPASIGPRPASMGPRAVAMGPRSLSAGPRPVSLVARLQKPQVYTDNADYDDDSRPPSPCSDNDEDDVKPTEPMHVQCILPGCTNNALYDTKNGIERSYYTFPVGDKERLNLWLLAIPQSESMNITSLSWICSDHFIGGKKSDAKSSAGYVPTIFPNSRKRPGEPLLNPVIAKQVHSLSQSSNVHQGPRTLSTASATRSQLTSQPRLKPSVPPQITFRSIRPKPANSNAGAPQENMGIRRLIIIRPQSGVINQSQEAIKLNQGPAQFVIPGKSLLKSQPGLNTVPASTELQTTATNTTTQAQEHSLLSADDVSRAQPKLVPDDPDSEDTVSAGSPTSDDVNSSDELLLSGLAKPKTEQDEPTVDSNKSIPGADDVGPDLDTALTQVRSQVTAQGDISSNSNTVTDEGTKTPDNAEETKIKTEKMEDDKRDDRCTVPGCLNNSMGDALLNVRRDYFTYPIEDPKRLKLWLQVIDRVTWTPAWDSKICSDHFAGGLKTDTLGSKGYFPMVALPAKRSSDTDNQIVQGRVVNFQPPTNKQTSSAKQPVRKTITLRKLPLLKPKPQPASAPSMEKGGQDPPYITTAGAPSMEKGGLDHPYITTPGAPSMEKVQDPPYITTAGAPSMEKGQDPPYINTAGAPSMEKGQDPPYITTAGAPSMEKGQDPSYITTAGAPSMEKGQDPPYITTAGAPSMEKGQDPPYITTAGAPSMEKGQDPPYITTAGAPSMEKGQDHPYITTAGAPIMEKGQDPLSARAISQGQFVIAKGHTPSPVSMFANTHASFHLNDPKSSATFSGHSNCETCIQGFEDTRQLENHLVLNHLKIKLLPKPRRQYKLQRPSACIVPVPAQPQSVPKQYKCTMCGLVLQNLTQVQAHVEEHARKNEMPDNAKCSIKPPPRATISRILAQRAKLTPGMPPQNKVSVVRKTPASNVQTGTNMTSLATSQPPSFSITNPVSTCHVVSSSGSQPSTTNAAPLKVSNKLLQNLISMLQGSPKPLNQHQEATVADMSSKQSVVMVKPSVSSTAAISNTARSGAVTSSAETSFTPQPARTVSLASTSMKKPAVIVVKKRPSSSVTRPVTTPSAAVSSDSTSTKRRSKILIKQSQSSSATTSVTPQPAGTVTADTNSVKRPAMIVIKPRPAPSVVTPITMQSAVTTSASSGTTKPSILIKASPTSLNTKQPMVTAPSGKTSGSASISQELTTRKLVLTPQRQSQVANKHVPLKGGRKSPHVIVPLVKPSAQSILHAKYRAKRKAMYIQKSALDRTLVDILEAKQAKRKQENEPTEPGQVVICHTCQSFHTSSAEFAAHMHKRHRKGPDSKITCEVCTQEFVSYSNLMDHIYPLCPKAREGVLQCKPCDQSFLTPAELVGHLQTAHCEKHRWCYTCKPPVRLHSPRALALHKSELHNKKPTPRLRQCEVCGYRACYPSDLRVHMDGHKPIEEQKYRTTVANQCDVCGRMLGKNKSGLIRHMRTHTGDKPYSCLQCPKTFTNKPNLAIHMRYHNGIRPYSCDICEKTFLVKRNMRVHKRTHHSGPSAIKSGTRGGQGEKEAGTESAN